MIVLTDNQKKHLDISLARAERNKVYVLTSIKESEAIQFNTKREAVAFAKLVGWQANDAYKTEIMGFRIWVISDPHLNFLTARGALRCLIQRGWKCHGE